MIIINIFIALIIAIGFWRNTSKEHKRMVAKASLTKTAILFLLSAAMMFFYYKSYQVATFKNRVVVKGLKGSYTNKNDTVVSIGDTIINYSKDRLRLLTILSKFTNNTLYTTDPFVDIWDSLNISGTRMYFQFFNNQEDIKWYPNISEKEKQLNLEEISHYYRVYYYTNTIPNILPFAYYDNYEHYDYNKELEKGEYYDFYLFANKFDKSLDNIDNNYDKCFGQVILAKKNYSDNVYRFFKTKICSYFVNTLNFFSAADLTQCEYEVRIESDIPIDILCMYFDLPIEISSFDLIKNHVTSKGFHFSFKEDIAGKGRYLVFHVKFPTLANLQLIRSLILTTLMTSLLALFFKNLYYCGRNIYERRKRKQKTPFTYSKKMVLLWVPVGKIILWTFIVAFAFLLILSILNYHFRIYTKNLYIVRFIIVLIIVYIVLIVGLFEYLGEKGIYIKDLKENLLCKFKKREKGKDDFKSSYKIEEQPVETAIIEDKPIEAKKTEIQPENTIKVEDSKNIENPELKDGQKSSRKPSQPKKGKTRKRKR